MYRDATSGVGSMCSMFTLPCLHCTRLHTHLLSWFNTYHIYTDRRHAFIKDNSGWVMSHVCSILGRMFLVVSKYILLSDCWVMLSSVYCSSQVITVPTSRQKHSGLSDHRFTNINIATTHIWNDINCSFRSVIWNNDIMHLSQIK